MLQTIKLNLLFSLGYNDCYAATSIYSASLCPANSTNYTLYYNQTLASQLAFWASLAYVRPDSIDPHVLTKVLAVESPGQYRVSLCMQCYRIIEK